MLNRTVWVFIQVKRRQLPVFGLSPQPLVPVVNRFIVDFLAQHSYVEMDGGWVSKYDPGLGSTINLALVAAIKGIALTWIANNNTI